MSTLIGDVGFLDKLSRVGLKKHQQKKKVVRLLYLRGPLSISEVIAFMELSAPTVQGLLDELVDEGLIEIKGTGSSKGGRRPNLYGLKKNAFYILAIDIGRQSTRVSVFNNNNDPVTDIRFMPLVLENKMEVVDKIHAFANSVVRESGADVRKIVGVGIDMPGLVDTEEGINHSYLCFDTPVRTLFEERFEKPVVVLNDAQAKAAAEFRFGMATGKKNVLVLHIGSGLGTGLILNGKPYFGSQGFSGEFSHIHMVDNGRLCNCGKRGCLETLASGIALARNVVESLEKGDESSILEIVEHDYNKINHKVILDAALNGDQFAIHHLAKIGRELGKGIAILVQILNPELIILGGRIAEAGKYLTLPLEQSMFQYSIPNLREDLKIVISKLGDKANLLGSVIHVMENVFEN